MRQMFRNETMQGDGTTANNEPMDTTASSSSHRSTTSSSCDEDYSVGLGDKVEKPASKKNYYRDRGDSANRSSRTTTSLDDSDKDESPPARMLMEQGGAGGDYWHEEEEQQARTLTKKSKSKNRVLSIPSSAYSETGSLSSRSSKGTTTTTTQKRGSALPPGISRGVSRSKFLVLFFLTATAAAVAYTIYRLASEQDMIVYRSRFEDSAQQIIEVTRINLADTRDFYSSWSLHLTSSSTGNTSSSEQWPFVTVPNFEIQGQDAVQKTGARMVSICPIVSTQDRIDWEKYSVENQASWMGEDESSISEFIFRSPFAPENASAPIVDDKYLPIWQTAPIAGNQQMVNFDLFDYPSVPKVFEQMMTSRSPVLSETVNAVADTYGPPEAFMAIPIFGSLSADTPAIVGVLMVVSQWEDYLVSLVPDGTPPMVATVRNTCTESFTYVIRGSSATFLGLGDRHDPNYDSEEVMVGMTGEVFESVPGCANTLHIYPTQEFYDTYMTNQPWIYTGIAIALFILTALSFHLYDRLMKQQHEKVIKAANLSNALVSSLFPESVRSRIVADQQQQSNKNQRSSSKSIIIHHSKKEGSTERRTSTTSKPIADLFPRVTVMFADISGFTAWSSSREPSQVFMLLEAIYNSFDRIATRCKVFKVETIGDCYVAAAGLPDPRDDHAAAMARFSVLCLRRFREVVLGLEVSLGPETAELALRIGLHSGPVTAGVLRGEKSRFQLFGDTVNTASRMESTGASNQIHISQATADLVLAECDELSVKPREQLMEVKGKGTMQTYWLVSENDDHHGGALDQGVDYSANSPQGVDNSSRGFEYTSFVGDGFTTQTLQTSSAIPASEKQKRLIDWNVDVLQGLLKKVVALRSDESKKPTRKLAKLRIEREDGDNRMVIDEVKEVIDIRSVHTNYKRDPETIELGSVVTAQLRDFVTMVAQNYRSNHFHSFEHASHVTQSVVKLLGRIVAPAAIDYDSLTYRKKEDAVLHVYTYGITSDPLTQFAAAFSALIHDLDHKGVPNATLVKEGTEEAKRYKNQSVAEQNSVDLAWELLMKPEYMDLRACIYNSRKEFQRFRQLVVNAVMATDIVDKELKALRNKRWDTAFNKKPSSSDSNSISNGDSTNSSSSADGASARELDLSDADPLKDQSAEDKNRKATIVIEHLIQASDVSHTMQHWHIYQKWNQRFFFECYQAYLDGRADVDPADGWYKGELGFFDFYIIPLAKKLKECGVFGVSSDEFLQYAESNRAEWEEKGQDLVEQYIAAYKDHVFGGFRKPTSGLGAGRSPSFIKE